MKRKRLIDRVDQEYLVCCLFYMCHNGEPITKRRATLAVHYHIKLSDDIRYFQTWEEDFKEASEVSGDGAQDLDRAYQYVDKYWPEKT